METIQKILIISIRLRSPVTIDDTVTLRNFPTIMSLLFIGNVWKCRIHKHNSNDNFNIHNNRSSLKHNNKTIQIRKSTFLKVT